MQNILNKKDRTDAFFKFLFFFLVTVALVVAAAFFNFKVPEKHYDFLKTQALITEQRDHFQKDFTARADQLYHSLDTLGTAPANYEQLSTDLGVSLEALYQKNKTSQIDKVANADDVINNLVLNSLYSLKRQYDQIHKLNLQLTKLKDVEAERDQYKKDLAEANKQLQSVPTSE